MKTTAYLAALLCLLGAPAMAKAADAKGKTIGFSVFDMQYGFFQQMEKGTRTGVESAGYKYVLHDQKGDEDVTYRTDHARRLAVLIRARPDVNSRKLHCTRCLRGGKTELVSTPAVRPA